ncbi:MAG: glutathione S-transferase N-terminal domain-containing protein [Thermodesulfobacteriota bacterium]
MKLYQFESCPYCQRVRLALEAKGIEYEKVEVPQYRDERTELFELSGQYMVPVLVDGERVISDSAAIVAYLNEKY